MNLKMETEYGCWWNNGNGGQSQPTWLQSNLSDLEENTKSMLSLIKLENGDSFAERAETYYQKKPELEKRIAKYQQLYRLLLEHYTPILSRSSSASISTMNNSENNYNFINYPKSLNIESSNSNPEFVEDVDLDMYEKNIPKLRETNPKILEIEMSNLKSEKLSEMCEENISKPNEISPKKTSEDIFERLVDFEKRISCSEGIVEDNKRHVDELTKRYEEKNEANKRLKEQIEVLMKEIELLQDENLVLLSERNTVIIKQIKEKKISKFSSTFVKRLKGLVKSACLRRK